jgi:o-succinylbenzoate synthase
MADLIERITLIHLQVPFKEPYRSCGGEVAVRDAILVGVETAAGLSGVGEAAPLGTAIGPCWDALGDRIAPGLIGRPVEDEEGIAALAAAWDGCARPAAAGAETACWDLLAQSRHESLAEALGAAADRVEAGVESGLAVGLYPTVVDLLRAVEPHLDEGYKRIKLAVRPGRDVAFVQALRQHFGDEPPLMVDAGGAYTAGDIDVFRALDAFELLMIEQPLPADDLDGLATLQAALTTPICLDETAEDPARAAEAIRRRAGRIVDLKLQRLGGFGPALALHDLCREHGVACWVGTTLELGVGQAQGIHLAALDNCKYPTDVEPSARWFVDDYVMPALELSAPGRFVIPSRPGLGYQVDPAKVRRYGVRHREITA